MYEGVPEVSVIIPVYNCGDMLKQCLESVKVQSFKNIEIILVVNNGCTDNSLEIAESYSSSDERFRLLSVFSQSAGESRNIGLAHARGEYISFIDGDDRIDERFIENLYNAAKENDADISVCGFYYYFLNTHKTSKASPPPDKLFEHDEAMNCLLKDRYMRFYLWNKLWRKKLFTENNIQIPDMYYEDSVSSVKLFYFANKVSSISYCGYYYTRAFSRYTEISMTAKRANDYVNTVPLIRLFLEEHGCYDKFRKSFNNHIFHVYFAIPSVVKQSSEGNKKSDRENIKMAKAKVRLCCKVSFEKLSRLDLSKPVIE